MDESPSEKAQIDQPPPDPSPVQPQIIPPDDKERKRRLILAIVLGIFGGLAIISGIIYLVFWIIGQNCSGFCSNCCNCNCTCPCCDCLDTCLECNACCNDCNACCSDCSCGTGNIDKPEPVRLSKNFIYYYLRYLYEWFISLFTS